MIGQTLSRYKILSKLGEGGMGEVYLAEDTELGRRVAVKVLPRALAGNADRLERFRREARAVAALNHPNIVTIFNVEEAGGRRLLVMEHVDGKSLDRLIPAHGMPLERVFEIAVPLADALAAAHERGITHRDLKPANVMVSSDGTVKVLDFGLAKLAAEAEAAALGEGATEAATRTATLTGEGTVMGTAPYMSPEQLSGKPVDHRSDIFSLGIVLYEMVAGQRPFRGETGIELASSILKDSPSSVTEVRDDLPRHLGRIVQHCLEKDPERRFQSAKDIRNELDELAREVESGEVEMMGSGQVAAADAPPARRGRPVILLAAVAVAAVAILGAIWWMSRSPATEHETRAAVETARADSGQPTFAVLPFRNLGADTSVDYLRLAVPDEVITTLSRAAGVAVRPFSMTASFSPETGDPMATARDLGVGHLITGQYLEEGDRLSLTLEAIDVDRQVAVWRKSIVVGAQDLISLRQEVAETVERELLPTLGAAAATATGTRPTSEAAYDLYLRSLPLATEAGPNDEALGLLKRAVELDPTYAPAWTQLAVRYYHYGAYGAGGPDDYDRSVAAAERALELDPELVEPAMRIIIVEVERGRLTEAYDAAQRLVSRRPEAARAHFVRSYVLRYAGALDRAVRDCDTALGLDPHNPGFRSCGITNSLAGRQERALEFLALDADSQFSLDNAAVVRLRQGMPNRAIELFRRSETKYPGSGANPYLGGLEGKPLKKQAVDGVVGFALALSDGEQPYWTGSILAYLGAHEAALGLVSESVERGYCSYPFMETDPLLEGLRSDPALAGRYAEVRAAGRACHEAFLAHIAAS